MKQLSTRRYVSTMRFPLAVLMIVAVSLPAAAVAQEESDPPYWASIRARKVNMRVGPSEDFRISWVYTRQGLPLKVVRKKEGWRLVQDPDGAQDWVVARFLSRERGAIVSGKGLAAMREEPGDGSPLRWKLAPGVTGKLGECDNGWCRFDTGGRKGWVRQDRLWGAGDL